MNGASMVKNFHNLNTNMTIKFWFSHDRKKHTAAESTNWEASTESTGWKTATESTA
jgi:hypothetical protein